MLILIGLSCRSSAPPAPEVPPEAPPVEVPQAPVAKPEVSRPAEVPCQKAPPLRRFQEVSLFVLAEADTRKAAERARIEASKIFEQIEGMLGSPDGYPRIVASDELTLAPDGSPRRYYVVAGACTSETFSAQNPSNYDPTETLSVFFPGSHVLPTSWSIVSDAQDCPQVGYANDPGDWEKYDASSTSAGGLTVIVVDHQTADGSEYYDFDSSAYAVLRDDAGRVLALEEWSTDGTGNIGAGRVVSSDPPTLELDGSEGGRCTGTGGEITDTQKQWTVRAKNGEIKISERELGQTTTTCSRDEWLYDL